MSTHWIRRTTVALLALTVGAGGLLFTANPSYADVKIEQPRGARFVINIAGTITKNDAFSIAQRAKDFEFEDVSVILNSMGGDVDAALRIGRILRKNEAEIDALKCFSSCALIYIAGVRRNNYGLIGLHRPYLASAPQSRQTIENQIPLILQQLKDYVRDMGVTDSFYQEMVNTEPSAITQYKADEIRRLVSEYDATYDEIRTSFNARKYGITTAEMRAREAAATQCPTNHYLTCREAKFYGIAERLAEQRWPQTAKCALTEEEKNTLKIVRRAERREHALTLKTEACYRDVMLGR